MQCLWVLEHSAPLSTSLTPPPLKFRIKSQQTILDEMFVHNFSGELYI